IGKKHIYATSKNGSRAIILLKFLILFFLSQASYAQKNDLAIIKDKYEPYYQKMNIKMGILLKKDGAYEKVRINFPKKNNNKAFNIGSATKIFTAVLILQEMEEEN
ncbi:MAG TPA: hypothetical protein VFI78_00430, partial [Salinimicrobium sp.]|nr:hypothetical protein [Salinimicrobium sp.]